MAQLNAARRIAGLAAAGLAVVGVTPGARADDVGDEALALVREVYFEGFPHEAAALIDPVGTKRLIALLADPASARYHANALEALAISAQPGAFEAIAAYAQRPLAGAVDRATFRNAQTAVQAMGHLAGGDRRALAWLAARARVTGDASWSCGRFDAARVGRILRRRAVTGLALSGRSEALSVFRRLEAAYRRGGSGPVNSAEVAHLRQARALHARVVSLGRSAVVPGPVAEETP